MLGPGTTRFRLIGLLPFALFAAQVVHYWRFGGLGNLAWMCHVGNLLWTSPGLGIWILYVGLPGGCTSALAHVGGIIVGMFVLSRVRMDRIAWLYAFAWYLFVQVISRVFTSPDLNVNVVYRIQPGWQNAFSSYWKFWLVMTMVVALGLWLIGLLLAFIWPAARVRTGSGSDRAN